MDPRTLLSCVRVAPAIDIDHLIVAAMLGLTSLAALLLFFDNMYTISALRLPVTSRSLRVLPARALQKGCVKSQVVRLHEQLHGPAHTPQVPAQKLAR